jgi:hypothetical protein
MKKFLNIRTVKSNIELPKTALEGYINSYTHRNNRKGCVKEKRTFSNLYENIETKSAHAPVSGNVEIVFYEDFHESERVQVPVTTGFFFTCIKGRDGVYKMCWSCSMS